MIELTPDARKRFDNYLLRTRIALRGTRAIEPDEVEQNVIEHVELALAGMPAPVGPEPLRVVLEKLGPPERWLPEEEQPAWRRAMGRLMHGPDDWRLAYASFATTVLMIVFFPAGGIILLPIAFLLSRAYVQLLQERGEPIGARGWLVLPPIVIAFVMVLAGLVAAGGVVPAFLASEGGLREAGIVIQGGRVPRLWMQAGIVALAAGASWILLSGILALLFRPLRALFAPILDRAKRRHVLWLTGLGVLAATVGAILVTALGL
jgi:hypothetical protein